MADKLRPRLDRLQELSKKVNAATDDAYSDKDVDVLEALNWYSLPGIVSEALLEGDRLTVQPNIDAGAAGGLRD